MRSKVTGIEDSVSEGFDEMLACLPLPGCHETLPPVSALESVTARPAPVRPFLPLL